MVCLAACSSTGSSHLASLPDTSPTALPKPLIASAAPVQEEPETIPEVTPNPTPEVVAEIPEEAPTSPPPALQEESQAPGPEVVETKPETKPTPPPASTPCNDIHRSTITSMEKSIAQSEAYIATMSESDEKHDAWLDLQDDKANLRKYKRDNGCE